MPTTKVKKSAPRSKRTSYADAVDDLMPERHPPCFASRESWAEYLKSAAESQPGQRYVAHVVIKRAEHGKLSFNSQFDYCDDCDSMRREHMQAVGKCDPGYIRRAYSVLALRADDCAIVDAVRASNAPVTAADVETDAGVIAACRSAHTKARARLASLVERKVLRSGNVAGAVRYWSVDDTRVERKPPRDYTPQRAPRGSAGGDVLFDVPQNAVSGLARVMALWALSD